MTTESRTRVDPGSPGETARAEEAFVTRWSRRKQAARSAGEVIIPKPNVAEGRTAPAPVLTDKDMPPIENLTEKSDFSGFLSSGVSEGLRRSALRKLFHLPEFNVRCPLDSEYYDCHGYEPLGNIVTHEMREALEREAEQLKLAAREALLGADKTAAVPLSPKGQDAAPVAGSKPDSKT